LSRTETVSAAELASEVGALFLRVGKLTKRALHAQIAGYGLTTQQAHTLGSLLHAGGRQTVRDLGQHCDMLASTATGVVDRLEQAGFVRRERDRDDRRVVWIELTAEGRRKAAELPVWSEELARAFTVLSAAELLVLKTSVERVLAGLDTGGDA
jgi:DNA-binding MarR family transcriptional regulator